MGLVRSRICGLAAPAPAPASSVFTLRLMAEGGRKAPGEEEEWARKAPGGPWG